MTILPVGIVRIIDKFIHQSISRKFLIIQSVLLLLSARIALILLPFRMVMKLLDRNMPASDRSVTYIDYWCNEVSWCVTAVADNLPLKLVCFPRGIAAYLLLRFKRIDATLCYGVGHSFTRDFMAHVWVECNGKGVVGHHNASEYTLLFSCPSGNK